MNNLSLWKLSLIIFSLLLIFSLVSGYSSIYLYKQFTKMETSWSLFRAQNNEKARLHNSLYATLGYGGMIHNFKNLILRKDMATYVKLERSMGAVQEVVDQYLALSSSPAERLALNDIEIMLVNYQNSLDLVREEMRNNSSSSEIDSLVRVKDEMALRGLEVLANEIIDEHPYFEDESNKPVLSIAIRSALGYGGMIHSFKNYILRKDKKYRKKALESIANIEATIKKYLQLDPSTGERTALEDITRTLEQYRSNVELIDQGIENNLTPEEIDAKVKIDDSYALRGLHTLNQDTIEDLEEKSLQLSLMLKDLSYRERINSIAVICSSISLAIFIYFVFRKKIITPIKRLSEIMHEMALGNLDAYSEFYTKVDKTEFGDMETSLQVFKKNEIKRRKAEEEIRDLALTDPLTGLANRNQFKTRFSEMVSLAKREEKDLTLLAIDLDNFKPINDEYGHSAGDLILISVAKQMLSTFRETDLVVRQGGDEFFVIMYGTKDISGVIKTVEKLISAIGSPVPFGKDELSVGVSVGVIQLKYGDESNLNLLMQNADKALYKAKNSGKNTYSVYS